jgi:hypothetical protein
MIYCIAARLLIGLTYEQKCVVHGESQFIHLKEKNIFNESIVGLNDDEIIGI